jgi:hypothetical protein
MKEIATAQRLSNRKIELRRPHLGLTLENETPAAPVAARWGLGRSRLAQDRDRERYDGRQDR